MLREGGFVHLPLYFFHSVLATYPRVHIILGYRTQEEESKRKERKEKEEKESNIKKEKKEKINKRERKKKNPYLFYALPPQLIFYLISFSSWDKTLSFCTSDKY